MLCVAPLRTSLGVACPYKYLETRCGHPMELEKSADVAITFKLDTYPLKDQSSEAMSTIELGTGMSARAPSTNQGNVL